MMRGVIQRVLFPALLIGSIVMCAVLPALAQKTATPAVSSAVKKESPSAAKAATSAGTIKPQTIETEITESNVFEPIDMEDDASRQDRKTPVTFSEDEKQMMRINQSLKNLIEENKKLFKQKDDLQKDIEELRGERVVQETRLRALANERADLLKKSGEINNINASYEKEIESLKKELGDAKQGAVFSGSNPSDLQMQGFESDQIMQPVAVTGSTPAASSLPTNPAMKDELGSLMEENAILRKDTIKLHYNLANLFFEQGKYDMAAAEYKRVADLMPQDAATHYNLAFVSAEYLKDYPSAIVHYKKYIMLDPQAEDVPLVKSKILELQLKLQNQTRSYIDKDLGEFDLPQK